MIDANIYQLINFSLLKFLHEFCNNKLENKLKKMVSAYVITNGFLCGAQLLHTSYL